MAKIAADVGDTVRKHEGRRIDREVQMAEAQHELDWDEQFLLSLYGITPPPLSREKEEAGVILLFQRVLAGNRIRNLCHRDGQGF